MHQVCTGRSAHAITSVCSTMQRVPGRMHVRCSVWVRVGTRAHMRYRLHAQRSSDPASRLLAQTALTPQHPATASARRSNGSAQRPTRSCGACHYPVRVRGVRGARCMQTRATQGVMHRSTRTHNVGMSMCVGTRAHTWCGPCA